MKELKFKTSKGEFKVVDEKDYKVFHLMLTMNGPEAISLKEITEEQASDIADEFKYHPTLIKKVFKDYLNEDFYLESAIESLHSLLKSKGIHLFENPIEEPNINDFKSTPFCESGNCESYRDLVAEHREAEEKTFYNPYIFKL